MNKVFNINLGGYPFTIDENAYFHLKQYLDAIDSHFKNSEGFEDITTDIETRLAEIFREKLEGRQIVTMSQVSEAINIMGTPEDFGAESNYTGVPEDEEPEPASSGTGSSKAKGQKFGKRLYRNPDETIVGGVASGVSAYFGIEDPVWIRILFAIMFFSGGLGFPLYIILWIALPEAKTAKQKLEMRGEKIDVNNIAKTIEETINNIGDELNGKKKRSGKKGENEETYASSKTFDESIAFVRQSAGAFEQFVRTAYKPLFLIIGWILLVVLAIIWAAWIIASVVGHDYLQFLVGTAHAPIIAGLAFLALGIPLISIALGVLRVFFRMKIHRGWKIGVVAAAILSVSGFFGLASYHARDFKIQQEISQQVDLSGIQGNILELDGKVFDNEDSFIKIGRSKVENDELSFQCVNLDIKKADGAQFDMRVRKSAHGQTSALARQRAKAIEYQPAINEKSVSLASYLTLKNEKYRVQQADVTLKIPVGKSVKITENAADAFYFRVNATEGYYYNWQLRGKTIKMTENGVECLDCDTEPQGISQNKLDYKNFTHLNLSGDMEVHLHYGEEYNISLSKEVQHLHHVLVTEQNDSQLTINYTGNDDLVINITMPHLAFLEINNVDETRLHNFDIGYLKMVVNGKSEVNAEHLKANKLEIEAYQDAEIKLEGSGAHLIATFTDNADLDAEDYKVSVAEIKGFQDSDMKIHVQDTLTKTIVDDADLDVDGEPVVVQTIKE